MALDVSRLLRRMAGAAMTLAAVAWLSTGPAPASAGPFSDFPGQWSGTGKIRVKGQNVERLRCKADYKPRGSTATEINLKLTCDSDSYKFDLDGQFQADEAGNISGRWSERTRNVGGTATGTIRGGRLNLHVESSAFAANLGMVTRERRQTVTFDAHGGGQVVDSSITLRR
ncbi:MAG: hypothetical protein OJF62_001207 [Pseudolabrys sp.]|jgi:hypothetical protein|nr:hypothetical protein [Pseudolabrys sp.]